MNQETSAKTMHELIKGLGLEKLPMDKQEEMVLKMTELVLKRMFVQTMDRLNARDQEKFGEMMEGGGSPEEIEKFLQERIEDYDGMLQGIVENLREEMKKA